MTICIVLFKLRDERLNLFVNLKLKPINSPKDELFIFPSGFPHFAMTYYCQAWFTFFLEICHFFCMVEWTQMHLLNTSEKLCIPNKRSFLYKIRSSWLNITSLLETIYTIKNAADFTRTIISEKCERHTTRASQLRGNVYYAKYILFSDGSSLKTDRSTYMSTWHVTAERNDEQQHQRRPEKNKMKIQITFQRMN